ncbi:phage tail sheath subtilisin-like domain-containing protein [Laribacter hongkongensis]|uniref:phage tail sheath subtilisin-like domain-containing protein n=1 Tax=Laribacter hongkongensis TaxID=168471 RepID=UPI001EFC8E26|nr:phage tail sheath family protein [Laribacter hongkongensis]MCG9093997.1 phage tail sheath family protein [Laribacter hongkongensis]
MAGQGSFYHGVTVTLIDSGARTIALPSSSIIGLVDTYTPADGLVAPNIPVLVTGKSDAAKKFGPASAICKRMNEIFDQAGVVVVAVGVDVATAGAELTSAIIGGVTASGARTGLQALLDAKSRTNQTPRLIVAPGHSRTPAVAAAMVALADKLRAIAIIDGPDTDDEAAMEFVKDIGSKRAFVVDPGLRVWDTATSAEVTVPASAATAGLFARKDTEVGFWASPSNTEFSNILGTTRPVEYLYGDPTSRANLLNEAFIATIIRDGGYRLWGNRTRSADPKWSFVTRVRTVDMVMDAILKGHQWAVDRGITKTYVKDVTEGLNAFMRDLKAMGAVINFEAFPDPEKNTSSQLEQGRVYWTIRFTDVPPAENPIFQVEVTNQWITEVLDFGS